MSIDRSLLLDALRGIAVLAVMLVHTGAQSPGGAIPWYDATVGQVARHGYLGVQLFFVISGYCILGAVMSAESRPRPWCSFVARRLRRIYPPYWCSLLLAIGLGLGTVVFMKKTWFSVFPLDTRDWLLNLVLLQRPFDAPDATLVIWSLSIEVQFYGLMSVCLLIPRHMTLWLIAWSAAHLAWVMMPGVDLTGTPLVHWPEFAAGIAAFMWLHPQRFGGAGPMSIGLLTLAAIVTGFGQTWSLLEPRGELSIPARQLFCVMCGLTIVAGLRGHAPGLSSVAGRWLAGIGLISYSLYLTHVPIGSRVMNIAARVIDMNGPVWLPVAMFSLLMQGFVGWLFFRYCESRWLNAKSMSASIMTPMRHGSDGDVMT
jgi:peptidoglycan/LPS O-acetylase OafA/YrhL